MFSTLCACVAMLCAAAAEGADAPIVRFDAGAYLAAHPDDSVYRYDVLKLVASLQGLVNRERPRLLIRFLEGDSAVGPVNIDDYWLERLREGWLAGRTFREVSELSAVLDAFASEGKGLVLWDPAVPATANVAATICGVEGLLPVRADGALYTELAVGQPDWPVKRSLVGMFNGSESGSAKCDAYLWAKREYLDAGRCHPQLIAYFVDAYTQRPGEPGFQYPDLPNSTLANHDYFIARRAFFVDLSPWADETPVDDPGQPLGADRKTFEAILGSQAKQTGGKKFSSIGGFISWDLKYTNFGPAGGKHEPVPAEWELAGLVSSYNAYKDADALGAVCLTNASALMHHPLKAQYKQNTRPAPAPLEDKTYVLVYMGDYDSAAWLSRHIPSVWDDPARGEIPMAWAFNPNLADRVPYVFDHLYRTKSANDWFIGGDSGVGYLNPNLLEGKRMGSGLPDALEAWVRHNHAYYARFDYSITGFVINGFHGDMPLRVQRAYAKFSPDGVGMQLGFAEPLVNGTPFLRHAGDIYPDLNDLSKTAAEMARHAVEEKPQFVIYRLILQKPSTVKALWDRLNAEHAQHRWAFVDPYTFFDQYKRHLQSQP